MANLFGIFFCNKCLEGHYEVWKLGQLEEADLEAELSEYVALTTSEGAAYKIADALNASLEEELTSVRGS